MSGVLVREFAAKSRWTPGDCKRATTEAAINGDVDAITWLYANDLLDPDMAVELAAANDRIEVLKCLQRLHVWWTQGASEEAARAGCISSLDWARREGFLAGKAVSAVSRVAAFAGRTEVLEWAHRYGIIDVKAYEQASIAGRVDILQWLSDHEYKVSVDTADAIRRNAYRWRREDVHSWLERSFRCAARP